MLEEAARPLAVHGLVAEFLLVGREALDQAVPVEDLHEAGEEVAHAELPLEVEGEEVSGHYVADSLGEERDACLVGTV